MNNSLQISGDLTNLIQLRNFVRKFLSPYSLTDKEVNLIVLAVDEISANIIEHAYKGQNNQFIWLTINKTKNGFVFELSDKGIAFDKSKYIKPDIKKSIEEGLGGGMGLFLVNKIMDEVEFTTDKTATNICRLYKTVPTTSKTSNNLLLISFFPLVAAYLIIMKYF